MNFIMEKVQGSNCSNRSFLQWLCVLYLQSLKGPHHYQIGDHGGLLVAVSRSEPSPNVIKFSTDEGKCWKEYKFTNNILNFTGML